MGGFLPGGVLYDRSVAFENSGEGGGFGPIFGNPFPAGGTGEPDDPWNQPQTPPTFGPIFSPPDLTPPFGTITTPPTVERDVNVPVSRDTFGGLMPDLMGLVQQRGSLLSRVIGLGVQVAGGFLPQGQPTVPQPFPGLENNLPSVQTQPGSVVFTRTGTSGCTINTPNKCGGTRSRRGRIVLGPDGQMACLPAKRRMSPCNPDAARRAVRRLNAVHNFMRSIEKSMSKACRPMHPARRSSGGKCGTCRKTKCSC